MYLDADGAQSLLFGLPHLHVTQVQCTSQSWMLQMVLQYLRLLLKTEPQQTLTQNKQNQKWKVPHISFPSKFGIISQMITFWQAITRNSQDKVSQYIVRSPIQCDIKHANILCQPPSFPKLRDCAIIIRRGGLKNQSYIGKTQTVPPLQNKKNQF